MINPDNSCCFNVPKSICNCIDGDAIQMFVSNRFKISNHISNDSIHVTEDNKKDWNSKVSEDKLNETINKLKEDIKIQQDKIIGDANSKYQKISDMQNYPTTKYVDDKIGNITIKLDKKTDLNTFNDFKDYIIKVGGQITTRFQDYYTKKQLDDKGVGKDYTITKFQLNEDGDAIILEQGEVKWNIDVSNINGSQTGGNYITRKQLNDSLLQYTTKDSMRSLTISMNGKVKKYTPNQPSGDASIGQDYFFQFDSSDFGIGQYVMYYQNTSSFDSAPAIPDKGKLPSEYGSNTEQGKWSIVFTPRQKGQFTWQTSVYMDSDSNPQEWTQAVCITGYDGKDGVDTTSREYIYHLATDSNYENLNLPTQVSSNDGFVPTDEGWTDHPKGVDEVNTYEMFCWRDKQNGSWTEWKPIGGKPMVWSHYGVNGIDGDGVEYIYCVSEKEPADNPQNWYTDVQSKNNEVDSDGVNYNSDQYIKKGSIWVQDPIDIKADASNQGKYQYVSIRKRTTDNDRQLYWHQYSKPTIWSYFPVDGSYGLKGSVLHYAGDWQRGLTYRDGTSNEDLIAYQDYVKYTSTEDLQSEESISKGGDGYYLCISSINSDTIAPYGEDGSDKVWQPISSTGNQIMDVVIANQGKFNNISANQVIITDKNDQVVAGMKQYTEEASSNSDAVAMWAGTPTTSGDIRTTPFNIRYDGSISATSGIIGPLKISDDYLYFGNKDSEIKDRDNCIKIGKTSISCSRYSFYDHSKTSTNYLYDFGNGLSLYPGSSGRATNYNSAAVIRNTSCNSSHFDTPVALMLSSEDDYYNKLKITPQYTVEDYQSAYDLSSSIYGRFALLMTNGMVGGLRPSVKIISYEGTEVLKQTLLSELDFFVFINSSKGPVHVYLPENPQLGQTYFIFRETGVLTIVYGNGTDIVHPEGQSSSVELIADHIPELDIIVFNGSYWRLHWIGPKSW